MAFARWLLLVIILPILAGIALSWFCAVCFSAEPIPQRQYQAMEHFGYLFFFDRAVQSRDGNMCCADCHNPAPEFGWSDGRRLAVGPEGTGKGRGILNIRRTAPLINVSGLENHLSNADGRAANTMASCLQAVADPLVEDMPSIAACLERVNARERYQRLAQQAFGRPSVTATQLRECVVIFLRSIQYNDLPADRLAAGRPVALPDEAIEGWEIFQTHGCTECHRPESDWRDYQFHDVGVCARSGSSDRLRGAVTGRREDDFKCATPTLRGLPHRARFMHDGSFDSIEQVADYFAVGCQYRRKGETRARSSSTLDPLVKDIRIDVEGTRKLASFLRLGFQGPNYPYRENPFKQ